MSYRDHRLEEELRGVANCPHCGIASPLLRQVWASGYYTPRADGGLPCRWAAYLCSTCGGVVSARGSETETVERPLVDKIFPDIWEPETVLPTSVRKFLSQAYKTLSTPDASVVMSASSIDAMLKVHELVDGSLYVRIGKAVEKGILTKAMSEWAHRVRLDANNPRHADKAKPHLDPEDAKRAFEYAEALAEFLFVLPSRMPSVEPNQ